MTRSWTFTKRDTSNKSTIIIIADALKQVQVPSILLRSENITSSVTIILLGSPFRWRSVFGSKLWISLAPWRVRTWLWLCLFRAKKRGLSCTRNFGFGSVTLKYYIYPQESYMTQGITWIPKLWSDLPLCVLTETANWDPNFQATEWTFFGTFQYNGWQIINSTRAEDSVQIGKWIEAWRLICQNINECLDREYKNTKGTQAQKVNVHM